MGGKAKAPDYSSLASASRESAALMSSLGQQQLDEAKRQYDLAFPFLSQIAQGQYDIMQQSAEQGRDYYNYMRDTFRPLEDRMVREARDYNTEAKREELARQAAADAGTAFQNTQAANERAMASMGVNPNSGRFAGQQRASALGLAAQRANAMTGARTQAEALGYARMADAVGLGRGLPGASAGAYQVATGAGNSAGQNAQSAGNQYLQGMNQGIGTIGSGQQMWLGGLGQALNGQASVYNQQGNPWATLGGAFLGGLFGSSKALKQREQGVDAQAVSRAVETLPVDQWRYKPGVADQGVRPHIGPYAEDMQALGASDGRAIDVISALGVNLAAAKGLGQRLSRLERAAEGGRHG